MEAFHRDFSPTLWTIRCSCSPWTRCSRQTTAFSKFIIFDFSKALALLVVHLKIWFLQKQIPQKQHQNRRVFWGELCRLESQRKEARTFNAGTFKKRNVLTTLVKFSFANSHLQIHVKLTETWPNTEHQVVRVTKDKSIWNSLSVFFTATRRNDDREQMYIENSILNSWTPELVWIPKFGVQSLGAGKLLERIVERLSMEATGRYKERLPVDSKRQTSRYEMEETWDERDSLQERNHRETFQLLWRTNRTTLDGAD